MNILVSACLLGIKCRYDGSCFSNNEIEKLRNVYNLIPICPEIYGVLETPREPCEILGDRVMTKSGINITKSFYDGAKEVLNLARFFDCKYAILKERSPSCGCNEIYDGTFSGTVIKGRGITANLLFENDISIFSEEQVDKINLL